MKIQQIFPCIAVLAATQLGATNLGAAIEDWQFDEAADTQLSGLINSVGSAAWGGDVPNVVTDGNGNLDFTVSVDDPETAETDESTNSLFRNSDLTTAQSTGKFELAFTYTAADLSTGDLTGANVGFTIRNLANTDLLNVRLQKQSGTLRLQRRDSNTGTNTDLEDFGVTSLAGPLSVRVILDLDTDTYDVEWTPDGEGTRCQTNIPMDLPSLNMERLRMYASTNATDWGATDSVQVEFLTLSNYVASAAPSTTAIEDWQFDIDSQSLGHAQNDAGAANLGGNADNAVTSSGDLVFTQGIDTGDNIFRNGGITNPDQGTGRFQMDWHVSSADLSTGDLTGANVGFGIRDDGNTDLFTVRLHKQNGTLRLQHRVGTTNTNLVDFGTTTLTDLTVSVIADMDTDTFSVSWQLAGDLGGCWSGIPMAATGLEFDIIRTAANTNTNDWGATDQIAIDYLTISELSDTPAELSLSVQSGPGAGEITLVWPTTTPGSAVLQESTDLGGTDPWSEVVGSPVINGPNYELTITIGPDSNFYRLNTTP
ncbi:hypothetical protein HAHE_37260 [Haloferula helveola]|uniref:Uncharacterized protein n=1 Tax=Haloferula helveola TaxID=490095 RepID=A0ABN6H8K6_9BACT|nr:hypothetical protein HAHE_37260 [Haloferula helveola]